MQLKPLAPGPPTHCHLESNFLSLHVQEGSGTARDRHCGREEVTTAGERPVNEALPVLADAKKARINAPRSSRSLPGQAPDTNRRFRTQTLCGIGGSGPPS